MSGIHTMECGLDILFQERSLFGLGEQRQDSRDVPLHDPPRLVEFADGIAGLAFLGADGLRQKDFPEPGGFPEGTLGYFIRPGKHSMTREDWQRYLFFAANHLQPAGH